jgi:hypothetical protein
MPDPDPEEGPESEETADEVQELPRLRVAGE